MNKLKLRKKLLVAFSLIAIISIILTAVFSTAAFWFVFADQEENDIRNYAITVARNYDADGEISELESYSSSSTRVTLISQDGTVLYDSTENSENMSNHLNRPEVQEALKDGYGSSNRMSSTLNSTTYYYAVRTNDGNVIRVSNTISSIFSVFVKVLPAIIVIVVGVFIICVVLSRCTTKKIINPIERMTQDLDDTTYEELVPLAEKISSQQREIKKQVKKLQLEKDKINTLIQNMSEGFILIDMDEKILMSNHSAAKFLGAREQNIVGKSILTFSRSDSLLDCVDSAIKGKGKNGDVTINGRVLQIITNPVYSNKKQNGVICLIIDVSAKKKVEKMRREFTANVTHELKTPLTSISGYAEIIASGLARPDDVRGFAGKIHKESGRLLSLIGDIIKLSQLDENISNEDFVKVDCSMVAKEVAEDLRSNAQKHNVTINTDVHPVTIMGNRNQIYELIYNLCDNAIRYNRPNGTVTIMTGKDKDDRAYITVSDTGIGIPEKHQKRIFERFYRVDKSRSKETGGTGLGLAIVKHIAERHGGTVTLKSGEGGSTFTVEF